MYNLSERQGALTPSDVSVFGQPEYFVQMGFIQAIETCKNGKKSVSKQAQTGITLGKTELEDHMKKEKTNKKFENQKIQVEFGFHIRQTTPKIPKVSWTFLKFSVSNLCTVISISISLILCADCYLLDLNCQIMFK